MSARRWDSLRSLFTRPPSDDELAEELKFHLEQEQEKLLRAGLAMDEARRQARVRFGGESKALEECRDVRLTAWAQDAIRDLGYAWRSLRHAPLFTFAVVGSLVLGISVNATVFTLMRAALFRPLAGVAEPERLVHIVRANPADRTGAESSFSYVLFQELQDSAGSDAQIIAVRHPARRKFGIDVESRERVTGEAVSDNFFTVLGVNPAAGRVLVSGDDSQDGGARVAVLSHRFWQTRFQEHPSVVGSTVHYDEASFIVVGVAAAGFAGVDAEAPVDVWLPLTADPSTTPAYWKSVNVNWLTLLGRLSPAATATALTASFDQRFRTHLETRVLPSIPARFKNTVGAHHVRVRAAAAGLSTTGRQYESQLRVLAAIAGCTLLICCANVANLVRARNERRRREFDLRRTLGASGGRLLRQLAAEGMLLGAVGGLGGLAAAPWCGQLLLRLLPNRTLDLNLTPDRLIVSVTGIAGIATALIAVTWPAWRMTAARAASSGSRVSQGLAGGRMIVVSQLATVMVLLVVAGLSLTTLRRLNAVSLGFDPAGVSNVQLSFAKGMSEDRAGEIFERVRSSLQQTAPMDAVSYAFPWVYDTGGSSWAIVPEGYTAAPGEDVEAGVIYAGPGFFELLRIPVLQGRAFEESGSAGRLSTAVVNDTFARRYFPGQSALGRRVRVPGQQPELREIVGVVGDVRHYGVRSQPWPMVYFPGARRDSRLLFRARDAPTAATTLRTVVGTEAGVQIETLEPLSNSVATLVGREKLLASVTVIVATLALTLAGLGLYGVVAYAVTCRRAEFGIRLALGAPPSAIRRLVFRETALIVATGVALGMLLSISASRTMGTFAAESPRIDWTTTSSAIVCLACVAFVAGWLPAWRAGRTDPTITLRAD